MSEVTLLGFRSNLTAAIGATAPTPLPLSSSDAALLCQLIGDTSRCAGRPNVVNSTVLLISDPMGSEAVRVQCQNGTPMIVERGLSGTLASNHPSGSCADFAGLPGDPCSLANQLCSSPSAVNALAACVADPVGGDLVASPAFLLGLVTALFASDTVKAPLIAGLVTALCATPAQRAALATCIAADLPAVSTGYTTPAQVVSAICANPTASAALAACLGVGGGGGGGYTTAAAVAAALCADTTAQATLAGCLTDNVVTDILATAGLVSSLRAGLVNPDGTVLVYDGGGHLAVNCAALIAGCQLATLTQLGTLQNNVSAIALFDFCNDATKKAALVNCLSPALAASPALGAGLIAYSCSTAGWFGPPNTGPFLLGWVATGGANVYQHVSFDATGKGTLSPIAFAQTTLMNQVAANMSPTAATGLVALFSDDGNTLYGYLEAPCPANSLS